MKVLGKIASVLVIFALAGALVSANCGKKPPSELKVRQANGTVQIWKVEFVPKPMCMAGDTAAKWGITNCRNQTLRLWSGMTHEQTADVFLHEVMHVVTGCEEKEQDVHQTIYSLAPAVRRVLSDNSHWADFVMHAPVSAPLLQYGVGAVDRSCAPPTLAADSHVGK